MVVHQDTLKRVHLTPCKGQNRSNPEVLEWAWQQISGERESSCKIIYLSRKYGVQLCVFGGDVKGLKTNFSLIKETYERCRETGQGMLQVTSKRNPKS